MFEKGASEEEPVQLGRRRAEGGPMQGWRKQQGYSSDSPPRTLECDNHFNTHSLVQQIKGGNFHGRKSSRFQ